MLELGGPHVHEGNLKALAWERQVPIEKIKERNLSKYDKVSMISRTREFLPIPLL